MANSATSVKNRYSLTIFLFLVLFLLTIFLFSKRALEPPLSLYRDFFPQTNVHLSTPDSIPSDTLYQLISPISENGSNAISGEVPVGKEEDAISDFEFVGASTQLPTSPSSPDRTVESKAYDESINEQISSVDKEDQVPYSEPVVTLGDNGAHKLIQNGKHCDLYTGTWVKDEEYPIYRPGSCPYVDEAFDCQINGRKDLDYLKWRWKPETCDLPRFNATDFLTRLRGKRLMLVGDSMNRNQFESMLCLLREGLSDKSRMREIHGHKITKGRGYYVFKFMDYNCSVEFVRSHFLVREGVRINAQGNSNPTLSIDRIDKTSGRWKRANILVFNTGHWWTHGKTARGKNYYKEGDYLYPQFDAVEAYRRALRTWAKWIDGNVDPVKQLIFYRGYSSAHFRGGDWDSGGSCNGETEPILKGAILNNYPLKMKIVEEVIREMQIPVKLLNVTKLTNFRKDGHPSVYGKNLTAGRKISTRRQDCSHWCLPGVPDAWNELIYATLVFGQTVSRS
ncbi:hypothetical protein GH714_025775 [Hevea brasiliensis]|uniref:Uncharacterized protein n=1 Tax=Hevea brasiliensis TaxID=3981 RepID=A0A6A6MV13_HEVBR|nr:hypothetical protein GH714_025775 [Hevea brasiliensis]